MLDVSEMQFIVREANARILCTTQDGGFVPESEVHLQVGDTAQLFYHDLSQPVSVHVKVRSADVFSGDVVFPRAEPFNDINGMDLSFSGAHVHGIVRG